MVKAKRNLPGYDGLFGTTARKKKFVSKKQQMMKECGKIAKESTTVVISV